MITEDYVSEEYVYKMGEGFVCDVDINWWEDNGKFKASAHIGEEYYETDPYKSKDLALCEVKGFLEGVKAEIEGVIQSIDNQINENNQDTAGAGHEG